MPAAPIIANMLNGWVNTTSQGGGATAFRKMITMQVHVTRTQDMRV